MVRYEIRATVAIGRVGLLAVFGSTMAQLLAQSQAPPIFYPPKAYYLALGDSITYGYQGWRHDAGLPPSGYNTGYVDVFGARLRQIQPGIITINYGCPGESTETFINGLCPWIIFGEQLHNAFSGTQLQAAVAFLQAHPHQVSPITITLWANDVADLVKKCNNDLICVRDGAPGAITKLFSNLSYILHQLRSAAPQAEIIVTGAWDSFLGSFAFADPLFQALNAKMAEATAAEQAWFANPFPIFNPQGDPVAETRAICTFLLLCTGGGSHPSDAGYQALAAVVFDASAYIRLLE